MMARGRDYADWAGLRHVPTVRARNVGPSTQTMGTETVAPKKRREEEREWIPCLPLGNPGPKGVK